MGADIHGGFLHAVHVTDDPSGVVNALKSGSLTAYNANQHEDLGPGLYGSSVPHYWRGRSGQRWNFLDRISKQQVDQLADHAHERLTSQVKSGYNSESEARTHFTTLQMVKSGKYPPTSLKFLGDQPINIDLANPDTLRKHGIQPGATPNDVPIKAQGKFAELRRGSLTPEDQDLLRQHGFHGAIVSGGMHGSPQVVIWDHNAIKQFGDYQHQPEQPQSAAAKPSPLYEVHGDNGMVARVFKHEKGYSVVLHDQDAGESVPNVRIYPPHDLDGAKRYAHSIAGPAPKLNTLPLDAWNGREIEAELKRLGVEPKGNMTAQREQLRRSMDLRGDKRATGGGLMAPSPSKQPKAVTPSKPGLFDQGGGDQVRETAGKFDWSNPGGSGLSGQHSRTAKVGDSTLIYGVGKDNTAELISIRTPQNKRGVGSARAALQAFADEADARGITVKLAASPLDKRTHQGDLVRFYQSLGFEMTGRKINPAGDPEMVRKPRQQNMGGHLQQRFAAVWAVDWMDRYSVPGIENHQGIIAQIGQRMGVPQQDMADFIQDVMVRALDKSHTYDPQKAKVSTWLGQIAGSVAINRRRDAGRLKRGGDVQTTSMHGKASVMQIPDHGQPAGDAEPSVRDRLHAAMGQLRGLPKQAIEGQLSGKTYTQIAKDAGQKRSTMLMAGETGRKQLKELVGTSSDPQMSMDHAPGKSEPKYRQMELFAAWCDQHIQIERFGQLGFAFSDDDGDRAPVPTPAPTFQRPKQLGLFDQPATAMPQAPAIPPVDHAPPVQVPEVDAALEPKSASVPDVDKKPVETAPEEPHQAVDTAYSRAVVQDFGRIIPEARMHQAVSRGTSPKAPKDDRPGWARRYQVSQIHKSNRPAEQGKWAVYDTRKKHWSGSYQQVGPLHDTEDAAHSSIALAEVARNHRVYNRGSVDAPNYAIVRKITDHKHAIVKGGFATEQDAMKHMVVNAPAIIEHKFPRYEDYQYLDNVERHGPPKRTATVTGPEFQSAFNVSGGQFGNWQTNKDGVTSMNHAYDAFHDLADALEVDPKHVGLNGRLALAFGARGTGGKNSARAHYEPAYKVINLTKMYGAGTLAHEWAHALDHLVANAAGSSHHTAVALKDHHIKHPEVRAAVSALYTAMHHTDVEEQVMDNAIAEKRKKAQEEYEKVKAEGGYMSGDSPQAHAFRAVWEAKSRIQYRKGKMPPGAMERLEAAAARIAKLDFGARVKLPPPKTAGRYNPGRDSYEALEDLNKAYKEVTGHSYYTSQEHSPGNKMYWALWRHDKDNERLAEWQSGKRNMVKKQSQFKRDSHILDSTLGDDYYQLPEEMMARSFEAYIADKLEGMGRRSDYLVSASKTFGDAYREIFGASPFPEGEERARINTAFDNLFQVLKTHKLWGTDDVSYNVGEHVGRYWVRSWIDRANTLPERFAVAAMIERFGIKPMKNQKAFDFDSAPQMDAAPTPAIPAATPKPDGQSLARKMFGRRATGVHVRELQDMKRPIREDYYHKLTGHQLSDDPMQHVHEIAKKAQAYRDPRFETFRAFFVDHNNQIVAHNAYSSRHPSLVAFTHDFIPHVQDDLKATGAAKVYFMHNHPSGNPEPSVPDKQVTEHMRSLLGGAYGGHIIVNHTKYSHHSPWHANATDWRTGEVENDALAGPEHAHAAKNSVLGELISNPDDLAKLFLRSGTSRDKLTVFLTNVKKHIRAVFDVDPERAKAMDAKTMGAIRRMQRQFAGTSMFAAIPHGHNPEDYRHLIDQGVVMDLMQHKGEDGMERALWDAYPGKNLIDRNFKLATGMRYQAMHDIIPLVERFAAGDDRDGKHPRPPRPDDMGPPAAKSAPIKAQKTESFHVGHLLPRDEVRLRDNVRLQNGQVLPKGHAVQFVKHENGLVHVKHGGSDIAVALPIKKLGIHRNEVQRKGGEHALRRGMEHDGTALHDVPASQFVNRGAGQIVRDLNTNKGYLLHGGKLHPLNNAEWKWNHAEQRGLVVSPMDVRHRIHRQAVLDELNRSGNISEDNRKRYKSDIDQQWVAGSADRKTINVPTGWMDRQASLRRTAANPPRLGPPADPAKQVPTINRQANDLATQLQRHWLAQSRTRQSNREMTQIGQRMAQPAVKPMQQQPAATPTDDQIPWWSQMEGKAEDWLWQKSAPMRGAFHKAWNEAKQMGANAIAQGKAAIKAAPAQAWQGLKAAPGMAASAIGSAFASAAQQPSVSLEQVEQAAHGDTIGDWTKQRDRNTGLSFWFHSDPSQGAMTDDQFHQHLSQPAQPVQPAGFQSGARTASAGPVAGGAQGTAVQPANTPPASATPAPAQAAQAMQPRVQPAATGNVGNSGQPVGNKVPNYPRSSGPVQAGPNGSGTAPASGAAQGSHRTGSNAGQSAPIVANQSNSSSSQLEPVAGGGSTGGVGSASQPRPKLNNLVRAFHAGSNQGSIQFADDLQRDLHDYAANEVYKNRGGQNRTRNRPVKHWNEAELAQRAGVDRGELFQHAHKTYLDVLRQTKGIRHGEHRIIKPFDQARYDQESQAMAQPAPRQPRAQAGAVSAPAEPQQPPPPVDPVRPTEQWSPPKSAIAPIATGTESVISVPGGKDIPTKYVLMDLNHVAASNNYFSGGPRSEPRYPVGLQPRAYTSQSSNDFKVRDMAQQRKAGYYMQHPDATSGAPVVTPDGIAINGNGRVMSLQLAASQGDYGWYKDELKKQAAQLGINPADVDRVQHPVLVRMVPMDAESAEAKEFARAGNITTTQQDSPTRTGASLGGLIDNDVLKNINIEGDDTLSDFFSRTNHPVLQEIYAHVPSQVRDLYFTQDRKLTDAGKEMVTDMLLSKMLPVELIERMGAGSRSLKNAMEASIPQLMALQHKSDITPQLNEAISHLMKYPGDTTPELVDQTLQQRGFLEGAQAKLSPGARMLVDFLLQSKGAGNSFGRLKVRQGLVNLTKRMSERGGMFGDELSLEEDAADALGVQPRSGAQFGKFAAYEWATVQRFYAAWAVDRVQRFDFAS